MKVAFLGLGIMGSRMAANLLKGGVYLIVYNRTADRADNLIHAGASRADTPAAAARPVDLLFTMLSTPEAVEQVALGENGFLGALRPGALWVDCSTVNPSFSRRMADTAREHGVRFVDAPVAGSKGPAENAQLLFLAGGSPEDIDEARPLLKWMGRAVVHAGDTGAGSSMKMVFNLLLGLSMLSLAEALVLGESLGLSRERIFDTLQGSVVASPAALGKRSKIEVGDYTPDFPLQWLQKDLHLAALSAYEQGIALPATNAAKEVFRLAAQYGYAEDDLSAIYRFLSARRGEKGA